MFPTPYVTEQARTAFLEGYAAGQQSREPDEATRAILEEMWSSVLDCGDMMNREWCDKLDAFFAAWGWPRKEVEGD